MLKGYNRISPSTKGVQRVTKHIVTNTQHNCSKHKYSVYVTATPATK